MKQDHSASIDGTLAVTPKHVAIYCRTASIEAGTTALEDQERACREYAKEQGWVVLDKFVRCDAGSFGMKMEARPMLTSLISDAKKQPRPYDAMLVCDSSRLSRNLGDVFVLADTLNHFGVELRIVDLGLSSSDPNFRLMMTCHAIADENYRHTLRDKVRRGMKHRALSGSTTGRPPFAYRMVRVDSDVLGHPIGHLEINEPEAATVRRIYDLYAAEKSSSSIAALLNGEQAAALENIGAERKRWNSNSVKLVLGNPLYSGRLIWNRTKHVTDPSTGKPKKRASPPKAICIDVPALRVIDEATWNRVQDRLKASRRKRVEANDHDPIPSHTPMHGAGYFFCSTDEKRLPERNSPQMTPHLVESSITQNA